MTERRKPPTEPPPSRPTLAVATDDATLTRHPIGTPRGLSAINGAVAVGAWLSERGLVAPSNAWGIQIALGTSLLVPPPVLAETVDTRLQITITADRWNYFFAHAGRASRVRVTDMAYPDDQDDYHLVAMTPSLRQLGGFVRYLEQRFTIFFQRNHAGIDTTLAGSEPIIRAWLATL